jgi:hypothetical protein
VTRLVAELTAASPEVREWWSQYDVQFSHAGSKRFRHPRLGVRTVSHAAFHVAERPDQTLVVYHLPGDLRPEEFRATASSPGTYTEPA